MSLNAQPDVAPLPLSIVGAFKAAPTLVKVLAADLYLTALWILGQMTASAVSSDGRADAATTYGLIFFGLVFALIFFLMGKGIARGARGMWLLLLVLNVVGVPLCIVSVREAVTVSSILNLVIGAATLALLLTPVVRQHCTKR